MSARDELLLLDGSDEWPAQVDAILARHSSEVLRGAADGAYLNVHASAAEGVRNWLLRLAIDAEVGAR